MGPELSKDPKYVQLSTQYLQTVFISGVLWNFLPLGPLRKPFYWLASVKYRRDINQATEYIVPTIKGRMKSSEQRHKDTHADLIQFAVDQRVDSAYENNARRHAKRILHLTFAGMGTSIGLLNSLIWQILIHPDYLEPLRSEIDLALRSFGGWNKKETLNSLRLLDSFIRETLRCHPPATFFGQRTAKKEIVCSDGLVLRERTRIAFPALSINVDPDNYKDPETFDGYRFADPDLSPRCERRIRATHTDDNFLS